MAKKYKAQKSLCAYQKNIINVENQKMKNRKKSIKSNKYLKFKVFQQKNTKMPKLKQRKLK